MNIVKMSCPSCAASISIPSDADRLVCTQCGSGLVVQHGEGYATLKLAEVISKTIQESSEGLTVLLSAFLGS